LGGFLVDIVFFEYMQQPRFWIARDEDGYWLVPARDQGWHERSPFVGRVSNLQPLRDFDGIDIGFPV
jgi:glucose-6-phosphate 1-epimerase